jgi:hypothetical protein
VKNDGSQAIAIYTGPKEEIKQKEEKDMTPDEIA